MRQSQTDMTIRTGSQGFVDVTRDIAAWIDETGIANGLLTVFIQHTSAGLTIQENADPDVMRDLMDFFKKITPEDRRLYRHSMEGDDDMAAHIRTSLTDVSLSIPVSGGRMTLGTWQSVYVCEYRTGANGRKISLHLLGE